MKTSKIVSQKDVDTYYHIYRFGEPYPKDSPEVYYSEADATEAAYLILEDNDAYLSDRNYYAQVVKIITQTVITAHPCDFLVSEQAPIRHKFQDEMGLSKWWKSRHDSTKL